MGLMPRSSWGSLERSLWSNCYGNPYTGMVLSSEQELKALFPEDEKFTKISLLTKRRDSMFEPILPKYKVYTIHAKISDIELRIAYECDKCNKIIIDTPNIMDRDGMSMFASLAGTRGYDTYCGNCNNCLDSVTVEAS